MRCRAPWDKLEATKKAAKMPKSKSKVSKRRQAGKELISDAGLACSPTRRALL
jgi:hypothetical protein